MGSILRLIFKDPEVIAGLMAFLPSVAAMVLSVLTAAIIWQRNLSVKRGIILVGAILSMLAFFLSLVVNYYILPSQGYDFYIDNLMAFQSVQFLGSIGGLMFSWGLYRYFKDAAKPINTQPAVEEEENPFIIRNS